MRLEIASQYQCQFLHWLAQPTSLIGTHTKSLPGGNEFVSQLDGAHRSPSDLVFPHGIPRACRLQKDAEANGVAYCDESGRYADFHALRYTWATFLQRNGIAQRFAMKLMRHSDIKLTSKVYTDETQLPIYDSIKHLPRLSEYTQIRAQILGAEGQSVSQADAMGGGMKTHETIENISVCPVLSLPDAELTMVGAEGFEPPTHSV